MWPPLLLVFPLVPKLFAGTIWDPRCKQAHSRRCLGGPLRGDGATSFDDWNGSTKKYSSVVTYTCNEGVGFDTTNSPSKVYAKCGKTCTERYVSGWGGGWSGRCVGTYDPAQCRYQDPEWRYVGFTGSSLPSCSVGESPP